MGLAWSWSLLPQVLPQVTCQFRAAGVCPLGVSFSAVSASSPFLAQVRAGGVAGVEGCAVGTHGSGDIRVSCRLLLSEPSPVAPWGGLAGLWSCVCWDRPGVGEGGILAEAGSKCLPRQRFQASGLGAVPELILLLAGLSLQTENQPLRVPSEVLSWESG